MSARGYWGRPWGVAKYSLGLLLMLIGIAYLSLGILGLPALSNDPSVELRVPNWVYFASGVASIIASIIVYSRYDQLRRVRSDLDVERGRRPFRAIFSSLLLVGGLGLIVVAWV